MICLPFYLSLYIGLPTSFPRASAIPSFLCSSSVTSTTNGTSDSSQIDRPLSNIPYLRLLRRLMPMQEATLAAEALFVLAT